VLADQPAATTLPYAALAGIKTSDLERGIPPAGDDQLGLLARPSTSSCCRAPIRRRWLDAARRAMLASSFYKRQTPEQIAALNGRD
jgi:putative ABC transport system permease protein